MEITNLPPDLTLKSAASLKSRMLEFRVGTILQAMTQSGNQAGVVKLSIGGQNLMARTQLPLETGQKLNLLVEKAGPQPELKILNPLPGQATRAQVLRQVMPRMLELGPSLNQIQNVTRQPTALSQLPANVQQSANALLKQLPSLEQVTTSRGLQAAVQQSGLFTEALLGKGQIPQDLKTALQSLASRLRSSAGAVQQPNPGAAAGKPTTVAQPGPQTPTTPAASGDAVKLAAGQPRAGITPPTLPPQTPLKGAVRAATGNVNVTLAKPAVAEAGPAARDAQSGKANAEALQAPTARVDRQPPQATPLPRGATATPLPPRLGVPSAPTGANPSVPAGQPLASAAEARPLSVYPVARQAAAVLSRALGATGVEVAASRSSQAASSAGPPDNPGQRLAGELSRQVEGALSRIQYNQLSSVPQEDPSRLMWQVELPLRQAERLEHFMMRVEEEKKKHGSADGQTAWRVDLEMNLAPLGPMRVRIGLLGDKVSSVFWAERDDTTALIQRRMHELRENLQAVGLEIGQLMARKGAPPKKDPDTDNDQLLDEKA